MGHVVLSGPSTVVAGMAFSLDVTVHGARPGTTVAARLRQTNPSSLAEWKTQVPISASGTGYGELENVVARHEPYTIFTGDVPTDVEITPDTLTVAVRST